VQLVWTVTVTVTLPVVVEARAGVEARPSARNPSMAVVSADFIAIECFIETAPEMTRFEDAKTLSRIDKNSQ
jgi:hypothetical protein